MLGFKDDHRSNQRARSFIAAILIPAVPASGNKVPIVSIDAGDLQAATNALLARQPERCSIFDFVDTAEDSGPARSTWYIVEQLPAVPPDTGTRTSEWFGPKTAAERLSARAVLELTYTARDMEGFARA